MKLKKDVKVNPSEITLIIDICQMLIQVWILIIILIQIDHQKLIILINHFHIIIIIVIKIIDKTSQVYNNLKNIHKFQENQIEFIMINIMINIKDIAIKNFRVKDKVKI
jgi:hypothetical protein